ncbi:hypothetical protein GPECTOR_8g379 [Gonium pectorale]|uniref:Multiple myeloma tumor-associated protein 2-like N-terminal domain-containing protein n=1 Tax=Gonium pectorale TaxID=33097 RepID=A0A150GUL1_GONPE|nr:hypothetical protein GPECTOR_8g379 [Gonium pectorale]|eukprot:KXZ53010.1 hypothetical protein GPECTOR_8g379 [Gonium pectorale]
MSLYNGPPRPGARGGRDQFSWDNVKADKDREYYLGHSVKALAGRWQKGRDVYWYTREKGSNDALAEEVNAVKQREEELMMEALGFKPKAAPRPAAQLDKHELEEIIKGKPAEGEEAEAGMAAGAGGAGAAEADRIKGLGYIAGTGGGPLADAVHVQLPGVGPAAAPPPPQAGAGGQRLPPPPPLPPLRGGGGAALAAAAGMSADQLKKLRKAEKRAKKEAKREAKKAKKAAKKAAKRAEREGRPAGPEGALACDTQSAPARPPSRPTTPCAPCVWD